jgi:diguanylate cyclase (GGDEF)-like protein
MSAGCQTLATSAGADDPTEARRQALLAELTILDTPPEPLFDGLAEVAATLCATPIALVTLLAPERQWFKARVGLAMPQTARSVAFCDVAVRQPEELLVVEDALEDPRFHDNPLVLGPPGIRFYAGAPLQIEPGVAIGSLCVIDHVPRRLEQRQLQGLRVLARQVVTLLRLNLRNRELEATRAELLAARNELTRINAALMRDALTDPLTGLGNRRALAETQAALERGDYGEHGALAVAMLDIDHFKRINDRHGHAAGDVVLRQLGGIVQRAVRGMDLACRYGGEEVLLVLPDTELAAARTVVERIRQAIARVREPLPFSVSVGLCAGRLEHRNLTALISRADAALYAAKHAGRNRVVVDEER